MIKKDIPEGKCICSVCGEEKDNFQFRYYKERKTIDGYRIKVNTKCKDCSKRLETSIQVSVEHRDKLKEYCDTNGYNMNGFVEKLIDDNTMKENKELKTLHFKGGTKEEVLTYLKSKCKGVLTYLDTIPEDANKYDLFEMNNNLFENQIDNSILTGSPLCSISMWIIGEDDRGKKYANLTRELFFIVDFSQLKIEMDLKDLDEFQSNRQTQFRLWLNNEIDNNPDFSKKMKKIIGVKNEVEEC